MWVAKWNNAGVRQKTIVYGYEGGGRRREMKLEPYRVRTNSAGDVFVAGKAGGGDEDQFDSSDSADAFYVDDKKVAGEWDMFVLKYNSDGVLQRSVLAGNASRRRGESFLRGLGVDSNDKVLIYGSVYGRYADRRCFLQGMDNGLHRGEY